VCRVLAGEPELAPSLEDARERLRLIGDDNCLISAAGWLGTVRERDGLSDAASCYAEAAGVSRRIHKNAGLAMSIDRIARLAYRSGRTRAAARMVGAVQNAVGGIALAPYYMPNIGNWSRELARVSCRRAMKTSKGWCPTLSRWQPSWPESDS